MAEEGERERERKGRHFLDHVESYLGRRDGVDKLLKISRYTAKLLLLTPPLRDSPRLKDFDSSVGLSRKAFRLGKFVQASNSLRRSPPSLSLSPLGSLDLLANAGEGAYYFTEQFVWLIKAGLIDKRYSKRVQKISAWAELIGYSGSISLKALQISSYLKEETEILQIIETSKKSGDLKSSGVASKKLLELRQKRFMKTLSIIQDFLDSLLALSDIKDDMGMLSTPSVLATAGLISALISTHKNWLSC